MDSQAERGELAPSPSTLPCIAAHHKCRSCERTRSLRVRMLSWVLGKFSLLLIIVLTSATTTFLYHKVLPDDGALPPGGGGHVSGSMTSSSSQNHHEARHTGSVSDLSNENPAGPALSRTVARLGLVHQHKDAHLTMTTDPDGSKFFTSGHVVIEDGALVVQRAATLFLSADVILNSMYSQGERGPPTVVLCLSLARGGSSAQQRPITCQLTYLRERDQQMARVWMLFQANANDRIYVKTSWPSYMVSDNRDNQQSVFQAFEV